MAVPIKPQRVSSLKKDSWWLIPTAVDLNALTVTEVNTASGLYITCFLLADQDGLTTTTEKAAAARLLCESGTPEVLGATTWSMSDLSGVFDPQAASNAPAKKAFEFLRNGFTGIAVRRQGVINDLSDAVVAGQFVDAVPVGIAPATPTKTGADASGVYSWVAGVAVTGNPAFNKAVVA